MNPIAILESAQRCNAVYIEDLTAATAAFQALGMTVLGQYKNLTHQAILSKDVKGLYHLTIAGTRISEGNNLDLLDDIWLAPVKIPQGGMVASGVISGMDEFWKWVLVQVPAGIAINVEGHSLGAERTLLTPLFLSADRIGDLYAFEAPQCATQEFWDAYHAVLANAVHTVCGEDIWYNWPARQGYVHDKNSTVIWFQTTSTKIIAPADWPVGFNEADHVIEEVIARIQTSITNNTFPH